MNPSSRPKFLYYGHSTLGFELSSGEMVMIDPWVGGNPACPAELHEIPRLDGMLITHSHADHFADVLTLAKKHQPKKVVANIEICSWLEGHGVANVSPMGPGGSQEVLGLKVTMIRADHSSGLDTKERMIYGGVAGGYVVRPTSGGFCFYHAGDTALFGDMRLVGEIYGPDLAFLPIGDLFTMGPEEAAWACRLLAVKEVVPIHWGTFPGLTGTPESFEHELAKLRLETRVRNVRPGESF